MELIFLGPHVIVNNSYEKCENTSKKKTAAYCNQLKYMNLSDLQTILVMLGHKIGWERQKLESTCWSDLEMNVSNITFPLTFLPSIPFLTTIQLGFKNIPSYKLKILNKTMCYSHPRFSALHFFNPIEEVKRKWFNFYFSAFCYEKSFLEVIVDMISDIQHAFGSGDSYL